MKILSIGNSFSQDAQRYLHDVFAASGVSVKNVNLYIGGCSLERHYRNMLAEDKAYSLEVCGHSTGFSVSLKEALLSDFFDVITLQQVSHEAPFGHTFDPYLPALAEYVRRLCPRAKLYLHETWAYEADSARLASLRFGSPEEMLDKVRTSLQAAAKEIDADGIIPSGEAMGALMAAGKRPHRDTFHASLGLGRYTLALTWLATLTEASPLGNGFRVFDEPVTEEECALAQQIAAEAVFPL